MSFIACDVKEYKVKRELKKKNSNEFCVFRLEIEIPLWTHGFQHTHIIIETIRCKCVQNV